MIDYLRIDEFYELTNYYISFHFNPSIRKFRLVREKK